MELLLNAVAGVDVHKKQITITTLVRDPNTGKIQKETWESKTLTKDLLTCGKKLLGMGIKDVAMESTGIYWKPIHNVWSELGINITLGNATHIKNVPGRKTDVKDSEWIAKLHMSGLIRPSYIPNKEFQELRLLTRHRRNFVDDMTRIKNRIQKILEDGNVKLGSVISDVFGVAGLKIIESLAGGETIPSVLASCATTNIKCNKEELENALTHTFSDNQFYLLQSLIIQLKSTQQLYNQIDERIDEKMAPYKDVIKQLSTIPGIKEKLAEDIIAEATTNMKTFKNEKMFAAWAGVAPGSNESAGKKKE